GSLEIDQHQHHVFHPPSEVGRENAKQYSQQRGNRRGGKRNQQADLNCRECARKNISPQFVCSQNVSPGPSEQNRRLQPCRQIYLTEAVGHEPVRQQGNEQHGDEPCNADQHQRRPRFEKGPQIAARTRKLTWQVCCVLRHALALVFPVRNRGSRMTYRASTIRLAITMQAATTRRMACTTDRSRLATAVTNNLPSPGNEKTVSTTTAPAIKPPTIMPMSVTVGMAAFGNAC